MLVSYNTWGQHGTVEELLGAVVEEFVVLPGGSY